MLKSVGLRAGSLLQFRRFVRGTRFKVGQSCRSHLPSSGSSRSAGSATHHAQHDRAIDAARSGPPRVIRLTAATWADSCLRPAAPCITTQLPSAGTRPLSNNITRLVHTHAAIITELRITRRRRFGTFPIVGLYNVPHAIIQAQRRSERQLHLANCRVKMASYSKISSHCSSRLPNITLSDRVGAYSLQQ